MRIIRGRDYTQLDASIVKKLVDSSHDAEIGILFVRLHSAAFEYAGQLHARNGSNHRCVKRLPRQSKPDETHSYHVLCHLILLKGDFSCEFNLSRGARDEYVEVAGCESPFVIFDVVIAKCTAVEHDLDVLALAGIEVNLGEAFQLFDRRWDWSVPIANIYLRDVGSSSRSGIGHIKFHDDLIV